MYIVDNEKRKGIKQSKYIIKIKIFSKIPWKIDW